jgi:hypothetical protein
MFGLGMVLSFARDLPGARQALKARRRHWWQPWGRSKAAPVPQSK